MDVQERTVTLFDYAYLNLVKMIPKKPVFIFRFCKIHCKRLISCVGGICSLFSLKKDDVNREEGALFNYSRGRKK